MIIWKVPSDENRMIFLVSFVLVLSAVGDCVPARKLEQKTDFRLEEVLSGEYGQQSYDGSWLSDTELQFQDPITRDYLIHDVKTDSKTLFLNYSVIDVVNGQSISISADRKFILISYDRQAGFRHSSSSKYYIYSLESQEYIKRVADGAYIQYAEWGPVANQLVYVLDNNIYYISNVTSPLSTRQLTTEGVPGMVYFGIADWVYEEEVIGGTKALWFSPKGDRLLFAKFEDQEVPEITFMHYGTPGNLETQYPQEVKIRYPKAGNTNPISKLLLVSLADERSEIKALSLDVVNISVDIFYGAAFVGDNILLEFTNRVQNASYSVFCSAECKVLYSEENPSGWVNAFLPKFSDDGDRWIIIAPQPTEDAGKFDHLTLVTTEQEESVPLTGGHFVVTGIVAWDQTRKIVYYSATEENLPSRSQIYGVYENGSEPFCLSCQVKSPEGQLCQSAWAKFSKNFTYLVLGCTGPDPTVVSLYENTYPLGDPKIVFQDNKDLRSKLEKKYLPQQKDLRISLSGHFQAEVRLFLPSNADLTGNTKYPLLIYVYAGPDSKQITDGFSVGWATYLTSTLGIIYGLIDGRGSGLKGKDMLFAGYRALGTVEIEDQIGVTSYLQSLPYIDPHRTAIWGWSYGGYATAKVLETDAGGVFKCGISVAPVTSWIYYDSIYTERYMGLPTKEDNLAGYVKADLISNVSEILNLRNKQYYLIHGNGDDNVHYQQSMLFSRALELNDVMFQQQSYPDENHGLGGVTTHLYHSMDLFWKKCLLS